MSAVATVVSPAYPWRHLYLQALFETDRSKIRSRIREGEAALVQREHELFLHPTDAKEREAIAMALDGLFALRTCLGFGTATSAA